MLHTYVQKFNVMVTVQNFLELNGALQKKQHASIGTVVQKKELKTIWRKVMNLAI